MRVMCRKEAYVADKLFATLHRTYSKKWKLRFSVSERTRSTIDRYDLIYSWSSSSIN
jgi:50S ribosomal subunit-associated GTPase HflX